MNQIKALLLLCMVMCTVIPTTTAWGFDGHRIVAEVAQALLTPSAWTKVKQQMTQPGMSLADISTLPDDYAHNGGEWTSDFHYVNMDVDAVGFSYNESSCIDPGGCAITAINNYTARLQQHANNPTSIYPLCQNTSKSTEPCALSFLTHFVGDLHQPLHAGYEIDLGGNFFKVLFFGDSTQLHKTWDSLMIRKYQQQFGGWRGLAGAMIDFFAKNPSIVTFYAQQESANEWAQESVLFCRNMCYNFMPSTNSTVGLLWDRYTPIFKTNFPPLSKRFATINNQVTMTKLTTKQKREMMATQGPVIGETYFNRNINVVLRRLGQAAIRLAHRLNVIYDGRTTK